MHDLSSIHIRDQFIRGLSNDTLQIDVLAKASQLKTLEDVLKHSEAFETALRDQTHLQNTSDVMSARAWSTYKKLKQASPPNVTTDKPCTGCGSTSHSSKDRASKCPAWGKSCQHCSIKNHFARVCRQKSIESVEALFAHVEYDEEINCYTNHSSVTEIPAQLTPLQSLTTNQSNKTLPIFPDSGASICLAGPQHLSSLNISLTDLNHCNKRVRAVGGSILTCIGWTPMRFTIGHHNTDQPLYICEKIDRIYFSRKGCIAVKILPPSFPYLMDYSENEKTADITTLTADLEKCRSPPPQKPTTLPFAPTN